MKLIALIISSLSRVLRTTQPITNDFHPSNFRFSNMLLLTVAVFIMTAALIFNFSSPILDFNGINPVDFITGTNNNGNNAFAESYSESTLPSVSITSPKNHAVVYPGTVLVQGTAYSSSVGIAKVEAFASLLPFDNKFPFRTSTPSQPGNWSNWSIMLDLNSVGSYRILGGVTDTLGNENFVDIIVNVSTNPASADTTPPTVRVNSPSYCIALNKTGIITATGTANDSQSGIANVEAFAEKMPFGKSFPFKLARMNASSIDNASIWSIPLNISDAGPHRILVKATDKAGNENWDGPIINVLLQSPYSKNSIQTSQAHQGKISKLDRIAFVDPTFTRTAYSPHGFYTFYPKYASVPRGVNVTTDLDRLTVPIPYYSYGEEYGPLIEHVKRFVPNSTSVDLIGDGDVNNGVIFDSNEKNAYDVLLLLHNEYETQKEYDNLKQFVQRGGIVVFLDGNVFYAEVKFDQKACSITLVKGHGWQYDGNSATKSVNERWVNETSEWVGSNYIVTTLAEPVSFRNNLFNYSHFEENYVTNPRAVILQDYGYTSGKLHPSNAVERYAHVATYEMNYGKGKVIMLSLYSTNLQNNKAFLDFFDKVILLHASASSYRIGQNTGNNANYNLYWHMDSGFLERVEVDNQTAGLILNLNAGIGGNLTGFNNGNASNNTLQITIPKAVVDAEPTASDTSNGTADITVRINGKLATFQELELDYERIIQINNIPSGHSKVEILGTSVIPEFQFPSTVLIITMVIAFSGYYLVVVNFNKLRKNFQK